MGGLPSVAFAHLSEAYQAAGSQDQATLVLVSHAVQAIFNATDTVGGVLLAVGFVIFGIAKFENQTGFDGTFGLVTIVPSLVALVGISLFSIVMEYPNDPFFVILLLILPLILGLKVYMLSRSQDGVEKDSSVNSRLIAYIVPSHNQRRLGLTFSSCLLGKHLQWITLSANSVLTHTPTSNT